MDERIKKIAEYYGYSAQADALLEQRAEFMVALNRFRKGKTSSYKEIKEKAAEVLCIALQLQHLLGEEEIERLMSISLDTQIQEIGFEDLFTKRFREGLENDKS